MDKHELFQQIESVIKEQIANAEKARQDLQNEANWHKGRMQSRYDTFKEEAQEMATAHQLRKIELEKSLVAIQNFLTALNTLQIVGVIGIGSVVLLESLDGQEQKHIVLAPVSGGIKITSDTDDITVITPASPLGKALLGKLGGEKVQLEIGNRTLTYAILEVI